MLLITIRGVRHTRGITSANKCKSSPPIPEPYKINATKQYKPGDGFKPSSNLKDGYFNKPSSLPPIDDMEEYIEDGESEEGFDSDTLKEMVDELIGKKKRILH